MMTLLPLFATMVPKIGMTRTVYHGLAVVGLSCTATSRWKFPIPMRHVRLSLGTYLQSGADRIRCQGKDHRCNIGKKDLRAGSYASGSCFTQAGMSQMNYDSDDVDRPFPSSPLQPPVGSRSTKDYQISDTDSSASSIIVASSN